MDTQVVLIGGGPVGLAAAIELGLRGIDTILLERRRRGAARFPTANHLSVRSLEHMRRWGIADRVRAEAFPSDWGYSWIVLTHIGGFVAARQPDALGGRKGSRPESPESELWAPKPALDPILEETAQSQRSVVMRYGCEVVGLEQDARSVTCRLVEGEGGETEELRAEYAVVADGANSGLREAFGIELAGMPPLPFTIPSVYFRSRELIALLPEGGIQYVLMGTGDGPQLGGMLIAVDAKERWRLHGPGLDLERPEKSIERIRQLAGREIDVEVLAQSGWSPRQAIAHPLADAPRTHG